MEPEVGLWLCSAWAYINQSWTGGVLEAVPSAAV